MVAPGEFDQGSGGEQANGQLPLLTRADEVIE
jgi:hypothetical protein